ncbi:MAG: hypothetical protein J6K73_11915 [Clostridia bacterium]|nr:hypothetical protein [Clostridia bacterium]MBP3650476.1 hypothetical protein [Clostridia bacterium]
MKKIALFALAMVMVLTAVCPAFAAGKLEVVQEKFYSIEPYDDSFYAYIFAEVINSGDKAVEFNNALWEIYDANGDTLDSSDWLNCYPDVLEPGETGYVSAYKSLDDVQSTEDVADYLLTVSGKSAKENPNVILPATVTYTYTKGDYRDYHVLTATVTNDTDAVVYDYRVVFAIKDAAGNLIYTDSVQPSYVGILPGTSVEVARDLSYDSVVETLLEQGILTFDQVEVIAYVDTDY